MGIISSVKTIKEIHKQDVVLVKIGKFYNIYGKDAYILSYLFHYQLKKIEEISCCGFPEQGLSKVLAKLEEKKINYVRIDKRHNYEVDQKSDNKNLNRYQEYFEKAKRKISYQNRVEKISQYLLENQNEEQIKQIEEWINERRKI